METEQKSPYAPKSKPELPLHVNLSEALGAMPGTEKKNATEADLLRLENLFENLEVPQSTESNDAQERQARLEKARTNAEIENKFETSFIETLIRLHKNNTVTNWPLIYRGAMNVVRPELSLLVKEHYPQLPDEKIEGVFTDLAFQTIERIAKGSITSETFEKMKREIQTDAALQPRVSPPLPHPGAPVGFINVAAAGEVPQERMAREPRSLADVAGEASKGPSLREIAEATAVPERSPRTPQHEKAPDNTGAQPQAN